MKTKPVAIELANILQGRRERTQIDIDAAEELRRLSALCEEQKRLLELARDGWAAEQDPSWECNSLHPKLPMALDAITNHLLAQEGEKHE